MNDLINTADDFFNYGIIIYSVLITASYFFLSVFSTVETVQYMRKNRGIDYKMILSSPFAPSISLIAPAYNEGNTIIENVRSLLSVYYSNFEIIIVNDGSKDDSLQKLKEVYDLETVDFAVNRQIETKPIKAVYKSKNPAHNKLVVIDKENGGKADSLNAGINVAQNQLIACIDVDCILEQDAMLKMAKPFMEGKKGKVIATGGVVRIANSCEIEDGRIIKVNFPEKFFPKVQVLEYIRAFLLGRMAWSKLGGLLLISGAFGLFDRETVINCGGYNHQTVGEDMELVTRMRSYMISHKLKYEVAYIPDPLCWTEAPETMKILGRQRNRWTRGTIETLLIHKKMFFNPKFKILGLLSYPYWVFFEWLAPLIEFTGLIFFIILAVMGYANWLFILLLIFVVYSFAFLYSFYSILIEEYTFYQYATRKDFFKLLLTALIEPLVFHPLTVFWAIRGNIDFIAGKKSWGEMTRSGFIKVKK
jgi:cellulose synthase/poly-beta-1,6-N-acetylglucosamine synthase-like glycosyltransferase